MNENGNKEVLDWLLTGDPSIAFQATRDLMNGGRAKLDRLQQDIGEEGWGSDFMRYRANNGLWGGGYYLPKWVSTHYTLLDLKNLCFPLGNKKVSNSVALVLEAQRGENGGISYGRRKSDVCVNGMILNFASYFTPADERLKSIVDFLLSVYLEDGGWNCKYEKGAMHSSLHSTLSVLEGLSEFSRTGNGYRASEISQAKKVGIEFLLVHRLFRSHRTGKVIDPKMLMLTYPPRWRYDILRVLDYLQSANVEYDERMEDALSVIRKKKRKDGAWVLEGKHVGMVHFEMEKTGNPSRWNTLRALRVLRHFDK